VLVLLQHHVTQACHAARAADASPEVLWRMMLMPCWYIMGHAYGRIAFLMQPTDTTGILLQQCLEGGFNAVWLGCMLRDSMRCCLANDAQLLLYPLQHRLCTCQLSQSSALLLPAI
jgi:hypothetical protein